MDFELRRMDLWEKAIPGFKYNRETPFFEMVVPTVDTIRYGYLLEKLLAVKQSVLYTGNTGVGKVFHRSLTPLKFSSASAIGSAVLKRHKTAARKSTELRFVCREKSRIEICFFHLTGNDIAMGILTYKVAQ